MQLRHSIRSQIELGYGQAYERLWLSYKRLGKDDEAAEVLATYRKILLDRGMMETKRNHK